MALMYYLSKINSIIEENGSSKCLMMGDSNAGLMNRNKL